MLTKIRSSCQKKPRSSKNCAVIAKRTLKSSRKIPIFTTKWRYLVKEPNSTQFVRIFKKYPNRKRNNKNEHKLVTNYLLSSKISHKMHQFNHSTSTITSYYLQNYEQLGDLIHVGGSLTSLRKSLVQLLRMIATIADIQALYGLIELMGTKYNPH